MTKPLLLLEFFHQNSTMSWTQHEEFEQWQQQQQKQQEQEQW